MLGRPEPLVRCRLDPAPTRAGQVGEVGTAGGVELEYPCQGVEDPGDGLVCRPCSSRA